MSNSVLKSHLPDSIAFTITFDRLHCSSNLYLNPIPIHVTHEYLLEISILYSLWVFFVDIRELKFFAIHNFCKNSHDEWEKHFHFHFFGNLTIIRKKLAVLHCQFRFCGSIRANGVTWHKYPSI